MKNLLFILLPFQLLFSQSNSDVQKMFDTAMDSIILKNPKDYYFMSKKEMLVSDRGLKNQLICNYDFTPFKSQIDLDKNSVALSKKINTRKNNFFNRIVYGQQLKRLTVFIPWGNKENELVMIIMTSNKPRGKEYRIVFNKLDYSILEICEIPYIH